MLVTPASGRDFVTVRDFVGGECLGFSLVLNSFLDDFPPSAVHPWRMSMRDDLAKAKTVARREAFPGST